MAESSSRRRRKRLPAAKSPAGGSMRLGVILALLVGVNLYVFLWRDNTSIPDVVKRAALAGQKSDPANGLKDAPKPDDDGDEIAEVADAQAGEGAPNGGQALPERAETDGRWVDGEVQSGDSLGRILRRENMTPPEADEVIRALRDHMDFRKIRPGQTYRIRFDDDGRVVEFEFRVSRTVTVRAKRDDNGRLVGKKDKTATQIRIEEIGGRIDSSLYASVKGQGENPRLVSFFVDVFAYDVNFYTGTKAGDTFRMLVEKEYADGEFLRYRRVLAAEYSGKVGTFSAFYWQAPGVKEGRYYDAKGRSVEKSLLKTPLKYARISSKFNPNRMHPILHKRRGHMGVDYAAPTGTPVWSAASGKIVFRGWRGGAGNCVIIKHDNGLQTVYMHLSKFRKGQRVGQQITGKTVIGYVGSTGMSTGPHLHFGVKKNGRYVDPLKLEPTRRGGVAKKHRARFKAEIDKLSSRLAGISVSGRNERQASRPSL